MANESQKPQPQTRKDRVAIVTGASGGIGREIAINLALKGAKILLSYSSNPQKTEELAAKINFGAPVPAAIAFRADISDPNQVIGLFDKAEEVFGAVHILVNCAAVMDTKYLPLAEISEEDWDKTFDINSKGAFLCSKDFLR